MWNWLKDWVIIIFKKKYIVLILFLICCDILKNTALILKIRSTGECYFITEWYRLYFTGRKWNKQNRVIPAGKALNGKQVFISLKKSNVHENGWMYEYICYFFRKTTKLFLMKFGKVWKSRIKHGLFFILTLPRDRKLRGWKPRGATSPTQSNLNFSKILTNLRL